MVCSLFFDCRGRLFLDSILERGRCWNSSCVLDEIAAGTVRGCWTKSLLEQFVGVGRNRCWNSWYVLDKIAAGTVGMYWAKSLLGQLVCIGRNRCWNSWYVLDEIAAGTVGMYWTKSLLEQLACIGRNRCWDSCLENKALTMPQLNVSSYSSSVPHFEIDPLVMTAVTLANLFVLAVVLGVFGIAANVVNIRVFRRLGYKDGVNVTLTALSVSDIGALTTAQLVILFHTPIIEATDLVIYKVHLEILLSYVHEYFVKVGSVVTTFAAIERCFCVVLPLTVKRKMTPKVAVIVNVVIFVILTMYLFPQLYVRYFDWKFIPQLNKTVLYTFYRGNREAVLSVSYFITDMFLPYSIFLVLLLCSVVIFVKLKATSKWRQSIIPSASGAPSFKERKSVKLLMTISLICILLLLPQTVLFTALGVVRELRTSDGAYHDITILAYTATLLPQVVNCSNTIFVYYKMSTKYRTELQKMFPGLGTLCLFRP
ncbi:hypothetical protein Btru_056112 [Bulinus truncatus]|nr:hypothetical protein Btru_056112 [Bulinus truncatus]